MTVITSARVMVACGLKYSLPLLPEPFIMFARETAATAPRAQLGILSSSEKPSVPAVLEVSRFSRRAIVTANS